MDILYVLLVLLIVTRLFGEFAQRLGQPPLLGELISGVVLGIVVNQYGGHFPVLSTLGEDHVFTAITDLGIFFLMLLAGIELRPRELASASRGAFMVAVAGMLLPLGLGMGLGWWFLPASDYRFAQALFLGVALAVTAVPVAVKVLMELEQIDTRAGQVVVSAAIIDDVLSLMLLAVLTGVLETGSLPGWGGLGLLAGKIALFFALTILLGHYLFPFFGRLLQRTCQDEFALSGFLIAALAYAVLAELLGLHFILGAFMAGLFFGRRSVDRDTFRDVKAKVNGVSAGFLAPVFFASIGLHLDAAALFSIPGFVAALLIAAIIGKVAGAGLASRAIGLPPGESALVGFAMNARGAVELVIADVALRAGLFSVPEPVPVVVQGLFSAVVIMAIATTLMTPMSLRWIARRHG